MYNVDTRICSAYVDFRGIQVGEELLRKFFFFDGAIWRLNGISNYSLTTVGTTQCEFVKVMDMKAYTEGQTLPTFYTLTVNGRADDFTAPKVSIAGSTLTYPVVSDGTPVASSEQSWLKPTLTESGDLQIAVSQNISFPGAVVGKPRSGSVVVSLQEDPSLKIVISIDQYGVVN